MFLIFFFFFFFSFFLFFFLFVCDETHGYCGDELGYETKGNEIHFVIP